MAKERLPMSPKTRQTMDLIDALKNGRIGDELTDKELNKICGLSCKPGDPGYGYLETAKRRVRCDHGIVWERIRSAHLIRCLNASEIIGTTEVDRRSISRRSKKACSRLATIDLSKLNDTDRRAATVQAAYMGTLHQFSAKQTANKFLVENIQRKLPMATITDAINAQFGGKR